MEDKKKQDEEVQENQMEEDQDQEYFSEVSKKSGNKDNFEESESDFERRESRLQDMDDE